MHFNISKFRKTHEDDDYTTMQHPSGHSIKILHKGVGPEFREQLKSLPMCSGGMMAEGGPVAPTDTNTETGGSSPGGASTGGVGSGIGGAGTGGAATGGASTGGAGTITVTVSGKGKVAKGAINISNVGGKTDAGNTTSGDGPGSPGTGGTGSGPGGGGGGGNPDELSNPGTKEAAGGLIGAMKKKDPKSHYDEGGQVSSKDEFRRKLSAAFKHSTSENHKAGSTEGTKPPTQNYDEGSKVVAPLQEKLDQNRTRRIAGYFNPKSKPKPSTFDPHNSPDYKPDYDEEGKIKVWHAGDPKPKYADGDVVEDPNDPEEPAPIAVNVQGQPVPPPKSQENPDSGKQFAKFSNNPEVMTPTQAAYSEPEKLPYGISPADAIAAQQAAQNVPPAMPPLALQQNTQPSTSSNPTPSAMPNAGQSGFTAPTMESAYKQQIKGITGTTKALQDLSIEQANIKNNAARDEESAMQIFHDTAKDIESERTHLTDDIKNTHIDPQRLYGHASTGSKIASTIGLILGGLGGALTGQANPALAYLNKLTDQDIEAQKAELGKKENLLSANYKRFGDMTHATAMTKIMMADIVKNQLDKAAMSAQSPLEAARAQSLKGQIDAGMAPAFQTLAVVRSLQAGAEAGQDPSSFVKFVVPPERQAEAFKEIQRAQDTRRMGDAIMKAFDQSAIDVRPMSGGRLKNMIPGTESAYVEAMHQAMQPTFADLEGTVRQAAMDNTFNNVTPKMGNSDQEVAVKRQALQDYLKSKASAPVAKGFGIDLDKFSSTSTNPEMKLTPQQQTWATHARNNPNDPRSAIMLKKLGLQ